VFFGKFSVTHPGGKAMEKQFNIQIDRQHIKVTAEMLTGAQLRQLPNPPIAQDRDLFEVVPGGSDLKIANDQSVKMRDGLRFFSAPSHINPGVRLWKYRVASLNR
jgi:hypothetical protein